MNHFTVPEFWAYYGDLPQDIQKLADKKFELLKANPRHPSLHFKKVGPEIWSARVGRGYRAMGLQTLKGIEWFWIGSHDDYEHMIKRN